MVTLNYNDLAQILDQIRIAESHASGTPLSELISSPLLPDGLRTVDGSFNNFQPGQELFGSADQPMLRLLDISLNPAEANPRTGAPTSYTQTSGNVYDSQPRVISNLVADQSLNNPAAIAAALASIGVTGAAQLTIVRAIVTAQDDARAKLALASAAEDDPAATPEAIDMARAEASLAQEAVLDLVASHGITMDGSNLFIKNIAADLGDTASFNGFMTIFGQFFDHGLDLTTKGDAGKVFIPLHPDDPLYIPGSPTNFMVLTRATNDPGADGVTGTADDVRSHTNETTPWIDLNQVYTSNASHQVFLREYLLVDGAPVATGHMLEGSAGGPPTWADIKAQALNVLGVTLSDMNVHAVPAVLTDVYGQFVRGANGFPQLMGVNGPIEGDLAAPVDAMQALPAGRAFLNDIAHAATPGAVDTDPTNSFNPLTVQTADADTDTGNAQPANMFGVAVTYDNELLDRHFIVGDGRGNENIALTAVHSIFHGEHNRQVDAIKATVLAGADLDFLNEWLLVPVTEMPADMAGLVWNGERLFQASRFSTEMVYQHLVFEEFVRAISPQIDPFVFSNTVEVNPAIFEEFAQVVYRFGHSMLNENVDILQLVDGAATPVEKGLIESFLNPVLFEQQGMGVEEAAGAILRGMTRQAGNEIDEFTTSALRNNLVGLPLDLAALNIARARETGVPSLNEARRQLFENIGDTNLKPYESWTDFAGNLKNPLSVVNFIAAYGTHPSITAATSVEAKRDAAWALVFGGEGAPADRLDYVNSTGTWAGLQSGLNSVDFWIGGLAEALMPFGGMLGSTFNYVFEVQIQGLQNADRMYYLSRTQGMNLLTQLEGDSFADVILRNTDTEHTGLHINGAAFQTADYIIEMNQALQYNEGLGNLDPTREADVLAALQGNDNLVIRTDVDGDGDTDAIRFTGGEHVVLGGTNEDDTIIGGAGDDALWGDGGNDLLEGGYGVDHIHGGAGNDIITDSGTDIGAADVLKGESGDDVINGGMGLDLIFGGSGSDVISGGSEAKDIFAGEGNDFVRAPEGAGVVLGNEGDDWLEGRGNMITLTGDNSELFFNSRVFGHDVMKSGENDTDFDGESGDDIMVQGIGINRNNGMAGFDWVSYQDNQFAADADMSLGIFANQQNNILRDRFDLVEGISGWQHDDILRGREKVTGAYDAQGNAAQIGPTAPIESFSNALLEKNLGLIDGLAELVAHLERFELTHPNGTTTEVVTAVMDTSDGSDIMLGGGGSDIVQGRAGNDILDGDKVLNVFISIADTAGAVFARAGGLTQQVIDLAGNVLFGGRTLDSLMFDRTLAPSQLAISREIVSDAQQGDIDTAVYSDVRANYNVTLNDDGSVTVHHRELSPGQIDQASGLALTLEGTDRLTNIEKLQFADETISLIRPTLALDGFDTETETFADTFNTANAATNAGTAQFAAGWIERLDGTNSVASGAIRMDQDNSNQLRFGANAAEGATITRALDLSGKDQATISFTIADTGIAAQGNDNEQLLFQFAADGQTFVTLATYSGETSGNQTITLPSTPAFTANAAIRFQINGTPEQNEFFAVDNLEITAVASTPVEPAIIDITSTFTEGQTAISIASEPLIQDEDAVLQSAQVTLTNAFDGDTLAFGDLPAGISAAVTQTGGTITVALTGEASLADYQAALQAVTYQNTSENPDTTPRVVEVTVNDGFFDSLPATHTISVVALDDAMVAQNDRVVTNFGTNQSLRIDSFALLANDVDPDSALAITALSGANSLTAALDATGVVVTDTGGTPGGSFVYTGTGTDTAIVTVVRDAIGTLSGGNGDDIVIGNEAASVIEGGAGNDIIFSGAGNDSVTGGAGDDLLVWETGDGLDIIDGGTNLTGTGSVGDTFRIEGDASNENYTIYTRAAALANGITITNAATEIVVTRNGVRIAELDGIEEIVVNTGAGDDDIDIIGDFTGTSLRFNTITIDGSAGDDMVDISGLNSAHRIVFHTGGGNDLIVGTLRPQDVIEAPEGIDPASYQTSFDAETGLVTLSAPGSTITFSGTPETMPQVVPAGQGDAVADMDTPTDGQDGPVAGPVSEDESEDEDDSPQGSGHDEEDDEEDDDTECDSDPAVIPPPIEEPAPVDPVTPPAEEPAPVDPVTPPVEEPAPVDPVTPPAEEPSPTPPVNGQLSAPMMPGVGTLQSVVTTNGPTSQSLSGFAAMAALGTVLAPVQAAAAHTAPVQPSPSQAAQALLGTDSTDALTGTAAAEVFLAAAGNDVVNGMGGDDILDGGIGTDVLFGGDGSDTLLFTADAQTDFYIGGAGIDTIDLTGLTLDAEIDLGSMSALGAITVGGTVDRISGVENAIGGAGDDTISASDAANRMVGGAGQDVFRFASATAANGDTVADFAPGDRIDVSAFGAVGSESFTLLAQGDQAGAGDLMLEQTASGTRVVGHVDDDGLEDFAFTVLGRHGLTAGDFNL